MIRITVVPGRDSATRVNVEGRITEVSSGPLASVCSEHLSEGGHLLLDLSGVSFADSAGLNLLRDLLNRGCILEKCSDFVRALLGDHSARAHNSDGAGNEKELIARLRTGDSDAFEHVVQQYGGRMLATARRFLNNEHDAQDAVQEAFISAFRAIERFKGDSLLSTWLHRIVVNAALGQLRSKRNRSEEPIKEFLPLFDHEGEWVDDPARWSEANEIALERRDSREMVRRCIEQLPANYRSVLLLRDIEELDTEETTQALRVTANAVKVRLHRARQALKALIERELLFQSNHSNSMFA